MIMARTHACESLGSSIRFDKHKCYDLGSSKSLEIRVSLMMAIACKVKGIIGIQQSAFNLEMVGSPALQRRCIVEVFVRTAVTGPSSNQVWPLIEK